MRCCPKIPRSPQEPLSGQVKWEGEMVFFASRVFFTIPTLRTDNLGEEQGWEERGHWLENECRKNLKCIFICFTYSRKVCSMF